LFSDKELGPVAVKTAAFRIGYKVDVCCAIVIVSVLFPTKKRVIDSLKTLDELNKRVVECGRCPRLVSWREACGKTPPRRYQDAEYWSRPIAGFGDPQARLLIVGLAPAAHGGNRTGRMFTGDRSGDWLYSALHAFGFANQPASQHRDDGLELKNCYITAAVHCAPPLNKPAPDEFERCRPFLVQELKIMRQVRVVIVLGKIAFDSFLKAYEEAGGTVPKPRPKFGHGLSAVLPDGVSLICSYHPSQQNTFTGKLTKPMFHRIFKQAKALL
jgi:uracil-DNA glycosylase family 4